MYFFPCAFPRYDQTWLPILETEGANNFQQDHDVGLAKETVRWGGDEKTRDNESGLLLYCCPAVVGGWVGRLVLYWRCICGTE